MEVDIGALQMLPAQENAALELECPFTCLWTCFITSQ